MDLIREKIKANVVVEKNGCWIWKKSLFSQGYGCISLRSKAWLAHRISFEVFRGNIPNGQMVLHKCDVKSCVNPEHLYLGDAKQNFRDAVKRGLQPVGERHWRHRFPMRQQGEESPRHTLTERQVKEILRSTESQSALARRYGVSVTCIWNIVHRKTWRFV